ncbi:hypothetical protein COV12_01955 [Candidatus Woesearchaeota archaeon CG10_big_fil_rev_8_21_14_0_10_32_24]|nr:MAG: hypothetical protein COV12_01955 [Candidatus Woesearchaeota archaeon CG10_big_fil_rev_8_21_14_0_10_32_24]
MELISEINEEDVGISPSPKLELIQREFARAVLFNDKREIALLFVAKNNYHKLPGGGFDPGETTMDALYREVMEETGCTIEVGKEIGKIIEFKYKQGKIQPSYCYFAKVKTEGEILAFTDKD